MGSRRRKKAYRKGVLAEVLAAGWLNLKGYRIRERRFKCSYGEIDLIVEKGKTIIFVEVKARGTAEEAAEAIQRPQRQRISRAANWYIARRLSEADAARFGYRFDSILLVPWRWPCHILDAWQEES
jgi:putative endonuclease